MMVMLIIMDEMGDDQHYDGKAKPAGWSTSDMSGPRPTVPLLLGDDAVAPVMVAGQLGGALIEIAGLR